MVGSVVATMVWLSAARNIATMRPNRMVRISPWLSTQRPGCGSDRRGGIGSEGADDSVSPLLSSM
jgi:hypothetical protein